MSRLTAVLVLPLVAVGCVTTGSQNYVTYKDTADWMAKRESRQVDVSPFIAKAMAAGGDKVEQIDPLTFLPSLPKSAVIHLVGPRDTVGYGNLNSQTSPVAGIQRTWSKIFQEECELMGGKVTTNNQAFRYAHWISALENNLNPNGYKPSDEQSSTIVCFDRGAMSLGRWDVLATATLLNRVTTVTGQAPIPFQLMRPADYAAPPVRYGWTGVAAAEGQMKRQEAVEKGIEQTRQEIKDSILLIQTDKEYRASASVYEEVNFRNNQAMTKARKGATGGNAASDLDVLRNSNQKK